MVGLACGYGLNNAWSPTRTRRLVRASCGWRLLCSQRLGKNEGKPIPVGNELMPFLEQLDHAIADALGADRFRLRRRLRGIEQARNAGRPFDRSLDRLAEEVEHSVEVRRK